jgi:hypothetical protein
MANRLCKAVFWLYVGAASLALLIIPVSERGLFGVEPTPLAGVFAVLLAQPWLSLLPDVTGGKGAFWSLVLVAGCLMLNAALLRAVCRLFRR